MHPLNFTRVTNSKTFGSTLNRCFYFDWNFRNWVTTATRTWRHSSFAQLNPTIQRLFTPYFCELTASISPKLSPFLLTLVPHSRYDACTRDTVQRLNYGVSKKFPRPILSNGKCCDVCLSASRAGRCMSVLVIEHWIHHHSLTWHTWTQVTCTFSTFSARLICTSLFWLLQNMNIKAKLHSWRFTADLMVSCNRAQCTYMYLISFDSHLASSHVECSHPSTISSFETLHLTGQLLSWIRDYTAACVTCNPTSTLPYSQLALNHTRISQSLWNPNEAKVAASNHATPLLDSSVLRRSVSRVNLVKV